MSKIKNRTVQDITFDGKTYCLIIAIGKSFISDYRFFQFELHQRHTEKFVALPSILVPTEDVDFRLYQIEINFDNLADFLREDDAFDLVVMRSNEKEEIRLRVKSNFDNVEFFRINLEDGIFYPATTKNGNLSFYRQEDYLIAKLNEVKLSVAGELYMSGLFLLPDVVGEEEVTSTYVAVFSGEEELLRVPANPKTIPENLIHTYWYSAVKSFEAVVDLRYLMEPETGAQLKFYFVVETATGEVIQSKRMKINHLHQKFPIKRLVKQGTVKYVVTVNPTKKAKYLSVNLGVYSWLHEMKESLLKTWVNIRRSNLLLRLFTLAFYLLGKILPVNKKLVIFESFHGKQYSDNPRAIYEYMLENYPEFTLVWSFDRRHIGKFRGRKVDGRYFDALKRQDVHSRVEKKRQEKREHGILSELKVVRRFSLRWLYLMTRARYWVTNARLPLWIPKPSHTIYVQTWHGTPLKRLALDMDEVHMPGTNTEKYKQNFVKETAKWDYLISPNRYSSNIFRRAFQFEKELIESGYPRNDFLYGGKSDETVSQIKKQLGVSEDKKVILYAPTWRDNQFYRKGKYKFQLQLDLEKMRAAFGETHVILLRLHYLVSENLDISNFEGFVYDFSDHEDIRDLYVVADILVTDYSSVFFDYANLRRPMFFFVYDIAEYRDHLRGFYLDFEKKAPGPLTRTTDELIEAIRRVEEKGFEVDEKFYEQFCYLEDGQATKRVVERVFKRR